MIEKQLQGEKVRLHKYMYKYTRAYIYFIPRILYVEILQKLQLPSYCICGWI
jgi:hypothetical protein